jgi:hypothetical protein
MRVEPRDVTFSREFILRSIAAAEKEGQLDHAAAERFRRGFAAASDAFFTRLPYVRKTRSGLLIERSAPASVKVGGRPGAIEYRTATRTCPPPAT